MNDENLKHLEFIQAVIARLNSNSFQLKAITTTLVTALIALYASTENHEFLLIGVLPTFILLFVDAHYLQTEKKYIKLYNVVSGVETSNEEVSTFSMKISSFNTVKYFSKSGIFNYTIIWFYLPILAVLIFSYCINL